MNGEECEESLRALGQLYSAAVSAQLETVEQQQLGLLEFAAVDSRMPNSVGHGENTRYLWANAERGTVPIYPPVVAKSVARSPLDSVIIRDPLTSDFPLTTNLAGSVVAAYIDWYATTHPDVPFGMSCFATSTGVGPGAGG